MDNNKEYNLVKSDRLTLEETYKILSKLHNLQPGYHDNFLKKLICLFEENQYNQFPAGLHWEMYNYMARLLLVSSDLVKEEVKALPVNERGQFIARIKEAVIKITNNTRFGFDLQHGGDSLTVLINNALLNLYVLDRNKKSNTDSELTPATMLSKIFNLFILKNHGLSRVSKDLEAKVDSAMSNAIKQYAKANPKETIPEHPTVLWASRTGIFDHKLLDEITEIAVDYIKTIEFRGYTPSYDEDENLS